MIKKGTLLYFQDSEKIEYSVEAVYKNSEYGPETLYVVGNEEEYLFRIKSYVCDSENCVSQYHVNGNISILRLRSKKGSTDISGVWSHKEGGHVYSGKVELEIEE